MVRCDEDGCEIIELPPVTSADVQACQDAWANAIQSISATYLEGGDYITAAADAAGELYGVRINPSRACACLDTSPPTYLRRVRHAGRASPPVYCASLTPSTMHA